MASAIVISLLLASVLLTGCWFWLRKLKRDRELVYHESHRDNHGTPQRWRGSPTRITEYEELNRIWNLPPSETNN